MSRILYMRNCFVIHIDILNPEGRTVMNKGMYRTGFSSLFDFPRFFSYRFSNLLFCIKFESLNVVFLSAILSFPPSTLMNVKIIFLFQSLDILP